jgi:hypothetical protein
LAAAINRIPLFQNNTKTQFLINNVPATPTGKEGNLAAIFQSNPQKVKNGAKFLSRRFPVPPGLASSITS